MNKEIIKEIFTNLPNDIIATTHKDPDFDAIGSLLALKELVESLNSKMSDKLEDYSDNLVGKVKEELAFDDEINTKQKSMQKSMRMVDPSIAGFEPKGAFTREEIEV